MSFVRPYSRPSNELPPPAPARVERMQIAHMSNE